MKRNNSGKYFLGLIATAVLAGGCATDYSTLRGTFEAHPQQYRRVAVLPVLLECSVVTDRSLTTNELRVLNHKITGKTAQALTETLTGKGYDVVTPVNYWSSDETDETLDADSRALLDGDKGEFRKLSEQIIMDRTQPTTRGLRFDDRLQTPLQEGLKKFGMGDCDAIVLLHTTINMETSAQRKERALWNWIGGPVFIAASVTAISYGAVGPIPCAALSPNPNAIQQTVAVIDAHNGDVLFWSGRTHNTFDARDDHELKATVRHILKQLPNVTQGEQSPIKNSVLPHTGKSD